MNRAVFIAAAMLLLILLAACGSDPTATLRPTSTPAPQINNVSFTAADYNFTGPASVPAGMTAITLVNEGQEVHHQQLVKLPDGLTVLDLLGALESEVEGPRLRVSSLLAVSASWRQVQPARLH